MSTPIQNRLFHILVVDDDPIYLYLWRRTLDGLPNAVVQYANSFESAHDAIIESPPDLLISDIILPFQSGYDIASLVREHNSESVIVLTTAYTCDLSRFSLTDPHFHILHKPYTNIDDVKKMIGCIMAGISPCADLDEDSFSENEIHPTVMEWKL